MEPCYAITREDAAKEEYDTFLNKYFKDFSRKKLGKESEYQSWRFVARCDGSVLGIIQGHIMWGVLHIEFLMIKPEYRKVGLGKQMFECATYLAREHKCSMMTVETFDFQAPEYWKSKGFKIDFTRPGYQGNILYYLSKSL